MVFIDESGFLLAPLVRRTWAFKGQTPQIIQRVRHQGRGRDKVSVISALTISPKRGHLGLYFSSLINDYFDHTAVAWFLRQLLRHLRGPVIVVWDRGPMHQGPEIRQLQQDFPRLHLESLPAYAPDLNPVECIWSFLKWNKFSNYLPSDSRTLEQAIYTELASVRWHQATLQSYLRGSELPLPRVFDT